MTPPPAKSADHSLEAEPVALPVPRATGLSARVRLLRALALLPALAFLIIVLAPPMNHDVAAVLNFAERWLSGERLYRDLIDVNPPLVFIITLIPAALGAWTPLDGTEALLVCMLALCAGIWRMTVSLRRGRAEGPIEAATLSAVIPLTLVMAGYDFGQREHLMAICAIPYAILAARRIEGLYTGRALAIGVTLLAAIAFALKPHFLVVPGLIEAFMLLKRGPRRALADPLPWVMAAVWIVYLASIPLLFPDYFGYVVPLVWQFYIDLGVFDVWGVLMSPVLGPAVLVLLCASGIAFRPRGANLPNLVLLAAVGAFISAWVQHKGWSYHAIPVIMLSCLAIAAAAGHWLDSVVTPVRQPGAGRAFAVVMAAGIALFAARGESPWREIWFTQHIASRLTNLLRAEAYGERVLVLSPDLYPVYPALNYARAQSTLRTMNLWLLQGANRTCPSSGERYRQTWEMSRAEFFVYRTVAEDFAAAPPAVVMVAANPGIPWCGSEFNFIEYFSRHPLFAETWAHYREGGRIDNYRLYVREN
ncbi:MAG: hypothetical protein JWO26_2510 [Rhodospirillales bacterium]|nr:hypothetical protein [Rhodospirillales bacterium]